MSMLSYLAGWPDVHSVGRRRARTMPMALSVLAYMMLRPLPSSISTLENCFVPMIGSIRSGYHPGYGMLSRWSVQSKVMVDSDH